jgi:SAM-dependent methyltransferase
VGLLAAALALTGLRLDALVPAAVLHSAMLALVVLLVFRHGEILDRGWVLLGGAVLLRLLFLPTLPDLSVDPFRYLWDGWLTADGVNPYRYTPSDPSLVDRQHTLLFREMNSRDFFSIYPPLSQWLFLPGGVAWGILGRPGAFFVLKGTIVAAELTGILLLFRALAAMGRRPRFLALYAWNPLVLVAVAGVGHSEGGLVPALGILALGLARARPRLAWTGLGLAVISKGVPLLLAPLLYRHHLRSGGHGAAVRAAFVGLLPAVLLSAPFLFVGLPQRMLASADLYVRLFEFNAGLFALLAALVRPMASGDPAALVGPALRWAFLAGAMWIGIRHPVGEAVHVLRAALLVFGLYLVTATTVHPWYLLWGLPLLAFTGRHRAAWLWASGAAFLTYFAYVGVPEGLLAALFWGGALLLVLREDAPRLRPLLLSLAGRRKARGIRPHLRGSTILDLGAGEGYVGHRLRATGRRVILADVDPFFRVPLPGFAFDGTRLPLPDRSVDTVVLSLVLHHAEDPDALLREALRVAEDRVVITESVYRHEWERRLLVRADRAVNRGRGDGAMARGEDPLAFDRVEGWEERIRAAGGSVLVSRRLNRIGHRHHLIVAARAKGGRLPRADDPDAGGSGAGAGAAVLRGGPGPG